MRKRILSVALVAVMAVCSLCGCGTTKQETEKQAENSKREYFTVIDKWDGYHIVYANDTKVKYIIGHNRYSYGIFPLYNADGTLQIYEESEE